MSFPQVASGGDERIFTRNFVAIWLATLTGFLSFSLIQQPTLPLWVQHIGGDVAQVGWASGALTITAMAFRPFIGQAVDRVGRRVVVLVGGLIFTICAPLYAVSTIFVLLILVRLAHGVGMGCFATGATTYATDLAPERRRAELIGYYGTANNLALGLGPLVASLLLASNVSFQAVFAIALCLALGSVVIMLPASESPHPRANALRPGMSFDALFNRRAIAPSAVLFTVSYVYGTLTTFIAVSTLHDQLGRGAVAMYWLAYLCALVPVRILGGRLADRFGRSAMILPGLLLLTACLALAGLAHSIAVLLASAVVYGIGFGLVYPALLAMTIDRTRDTSRGTAMATFSLMFDAGIGAGAVISGLAAKVIGFSSAYSLAALVPCAGLVGYAIACRRGASREHAG